jgi:hypothetical protein
MCLQGASRAGAGLLAALPDDGLVCFYAWVPMLPADNERAARLAARRFAGERSRHYWDADRRLAGALGAALSLPAAAPAGEPRARALAWDMYLVYGRGVTDIKRPDFWMHQLNITHAPLLDANVWRQRVLDLLRA